MRFLNLTRNPFALARRLTAVACAGIALFLAGCASTSGPTATAAQQPKNIIIMFADGAAPTQWDFGKYSSQVLRKQPFVSTDVVFRHGTLGILMSLSGMVDIPRLQAKNG